MVPRQGEYKGSWSGEHIVQASPNFQLGGVKDGLWGGDSGYVLFTTISKAKGYPKEGRLG